MLVIDKATASSNNYTEEVRPIDKRIKPLLDKLADQGWRIATVKKGWMCYPPDESLSGVLIHKTSSDHRWYANTLSLLRQRGYNQ
ncbi:hypothetical protein [Leifsonia sp. 71-9]|uniref:hypothetical protein n=1 Tax=Leifsonia sp. 71-9 TaxID=1895934 RepID=UPI0009286364|nr:hypothetical protein [Leifsonia sp. 71-9]OJX72849.1 MAG: hypothetical protein BGO91_13855 [Leifsonia sp. 71-9]